MLRLARIAVVLVALLVVAVAPSRAQNASDAFALQFDGADDFVALPDAPEINETPRDERSIEAWFKVDDKTINTRKQVIFEEGGGTNGLNLYVFDGALYVGAWSEGTGFAGEWLQTSSIQSGTWHHVALVYDKGSSFTGYLDGSAFGSVGVSSTMDSHSGDVAFGRMQNNTKFHDGNANGDGHELKGSIDEGRVWNAVRTQSQIQNNRFSTLSGSETGLAGYWPFEEGSGTTTSDVASGNDGTLQNGVSWTSDDALPPAAPTGLATTAGNEQVDLSWNANSESDLDGYNVYRSTSSFSDPADATKVNSSVVTGTSFTDTGLSNGTTYHYRLTAVDDGGNESTLSGEATATPTDPAITYYVDGASGSDANDGQSWNQAFATLQQALSVATDNDEIWIAEGTYTPTSGSDRSVSFTVTGAQDGLEIYGGFQSGDTFADRSPADHPVILSGDIGTSNDSSDNSYNVLFFDGTTGGTITTSTVLDGVTVTAGNANGGSVPDNAGGGLVCDGNGSGNACSPTIASVTFTDNRAIFGAAMFNRGDGGGTSNPHIENSTFTNNAASNHGGALYNFGTQGTSSPQIANSTFIDNSATSGVGGAMFNRGDNGGTSSPQMTNVTFSGNSASESGGAIYNEGDFGTSSPSITNATFSNNAASFGGGAIYNDGHSGSSSPSITNATFTGNSATEGGAIYNRSSFDSATSPTITNTILWGNSATDSGDEIFNIEDGATPTIQFSVVEGGQAGISENQGSSTSYADSNLESDPEFGDAADPAGPDGVHATRDDGVNVLSSSPVLDAGDNAAVPSGVTTDITGANRTLDRDGDGTATVNMGAYEDAFVGPPTVQTASTSSVTGTTANLGGTVNPRNAEATVQAQVSPLSDPSDVRTFTDGDGPFTGDSDQSVTVSIEGLTPNTEYEARVIASNAKGGDRGSFVTFTTTADGYVRRVKGTDGTGNDAGWRMLALPAAGKTRAALEGEVTFSAGSGSILYRWDGAAQDWVAQTSSSDALPRGTGFMLFFFDDFIDPIDADGIPLAIGTGSEDQSADMTVSGLDAGTTFHLVGNPFDVAFDLSALNLASQGFQTTVQVWDPSTASFTSITQGDPDDAIAAWQGLFVERNPNADTDGTSLTFSASGKQSANGSLIGSNAAPMLAREGAAPSKAASDRTRMTLRLVVTDSTASGGGPPRPSAQAVPARDTTAPASTPSSSAPAPKDATVDTVATDRIALLVVEGAQPGWDAFEASQVDPPGGTGATVSSPLLRARGSDSTLVRRALASEPMPARLSGSDAVVEVPVSVRSAGISGRATIRGPENLQAQLPDGWTAQLVDTHTEARVDLQAESYTFDLEAGAGQINRPVESRFRLRVGPASTIPVELTGFEATRGDSGVRLTWRTASETNNAGFAVQRNAARERGGAGAWEQVAFVEGRGTTSEPQSYQFTDTSLPFAADTLAYRLKQIDMDGTAHFSDAITVGRRAVQQVQLHGSFPNPARSRATIRYALPRAADVRIALYDVLGRRVMTLATGRQDAGRRQRSLDTSRLESGTYFYRLTAGSVTKTRKLTIVR